MKVYTTTAPETEDIGIADNDIDGFLKNLLTSVNRECTQNSNDESKERPVRMSFDLLEVPTAEIPDVDVFREIIKSCHADSVRTSSKKGKEFFSNAQKVLSQDRIKVLTISDEGTKGAGGKFEKGGKFYTLVVSKGRTDKDNVYSAGSFGIGKNAAFAGSELRCVFYASNYSEAGDYYCMGKSVLTSWTKNNRNMSNKVFFGASCEELLPVTSKNGLPSWLRKEERGMQLSILAPRIELKEGWTHGYIASLVSNFFVAIFDEDLQFFLDNNNVVVNKNTILGFLTNDGVREAAESSGGLERLELAQNCIEAFISDDFISETLSIENLGEFEVLIKVAEDLPKKVCFIRNGMYITDTLNHFGKHLVRFPNTKDFVVVVRPKHIGDESSEVIKRMENPEHSELTTSYIADEEEVKRLKAAMLKLEDGVRKIIKKHAKMEVTETRIIEELREFFPGSSDDRSEEKSKEFDPTMVVAKLLDAKGHKHSEVQTDGGDKGGKGVRGRSDKEKRKPGGQGRSAGNKKTISTRCHSVRTSNPETWQVKFSALPNSGVLELWPEEESRSGKDSCPIKIESCSIPGATVSSDRLNVCIPLSESTPASFSITLTRSVSVVDMRPVLKGEGSV